MVKKIIAILLYFCILVTLIACSEDIDNNTKNSNTDIEDDKSIVIVIPEFEYNDLPYVYRKLMDYRDRFRVEQNVSVRFDVIYSSSYEDYVKKVNSKLYAKDGPELIFIPSNYPYKHYIDSGVALDVSERIPNLKKVYKSIKGDGNFYIPIGINISKIVINKDILDELGIEEPKFDWTIEEYFRITDKWYESEPKYFTHREFGYLFGRELYGIEYIDLENKRVNLRTKEIIDKIKKIREEIFSGKYILNNDYTYENYYNMIFNNNSEEKREAYTHLNNDINNLYISNATPILMTIKANYDQQLIDNLILPSVLSDNGILWGWGFIVNKNGKNNKLALKFLDGLLSDEFQLEMFTDKMGGWYPVNKEIEDEIDIIEQEKGVNKKLVEFRKYVIQQIKDGKYKIQNQLFSNISRDINRIIYEGIAKIVFADRTYSDEEIGRELYKIQQTCNMWLNE